MDRTRTTQAFTRAGAQWDRTRGHRDTYSGGATGGVVVSRDGVTGQPRSGAVAAHTDGPERSGAVVSGPYRDREQFRYRVAYAAFPCDPPDGVPAPLP
jgi:hypothetical protein